MSCTNCDREQKVAADAALDQIRLQSLTHASRYGLFDSRFAQEFCGFFWRSRVDVEAGAPLESRCLGQLGHEFDVPMVMIVCGILHGRSVDHKVVWRIVEDAVSAHEKSLE